MRLRRVKRPDLGVLSSLKAQCGNTWTGRAFEFFCLAWTISFSWRHSADGWYSPVCLNALVTQCSEASGMWGDPTRWGDRGPVTFKSPRLGRKARLRPGDQDKDWCCSEPKPRFLRFLFSNFGSVWFFTPTWTFGFADILSTKKAEEVSFWGCRNVFVQSRSSSSITTCEDEVNVD